MASKSPHNEWFNLVERSGPFLAISVLDEVFPQGLDTVMLADRNHILDAYDEWRTAVDEQDPDLPALHDAWIDELFGTLLHYDERILQAGDDLPDTLSFTSLEHGLTIQPDCAIVAQKVPRLLIAMYPPNTGLEDKIAGESWQASPAERMTQLCRATQVRLGLVTNGERWMLVDAPEGGVTGYTSWYARLWRQEDKTLQAFYSLFSAERFFRTQEETLEGMLERSLQFQEQVTDTLGQQVRRAVEVLTQTLDRADIDRNRELLSEVADAELYEASLTVMMRLVFLLCAEERELLLLGDPLYDANYALSTLRSQLLEEEDKHGSQVLESGYDAWPRLLALFRGVYGGIEHEALRLPALGGSLFDPDRYPFLEGRGHDTHWRDSQVQPLAIDNRTVLLLLNALQVLEHTGGAQLLSYRALDVEQIGHVYEGLLEHTIRRVPDITLGLVGSANSKNPNILLSKLESANADGRGAILDLLREETGRSIPALTRAIEAATDEQMLGQLQQASGSAELAARIKPYAALLRLDNWGVPLIYRKNAFCVIVGSDRRETGTHYTPKYLTEAVVTATLEPLVYSGPAKGLERENWQLKTATELLDLKICDFAMGSGAFLVQVVRYMGDRLAEAWQISESAGEIIAVDGEVVDSLNGQEAISDDPAERILTARRLVAERCVYGVDINPLAVELAKLSIWLVTLAKGKPFGFLNHNLRSGDSLLGIQRLDQLVNLSVKTETSHQGRLFGERVRELVEEAVRLRLELRQIVVRDIRDIEQIKRLSNAAHSCIGVSLQIADALVESVLSSSGNPAELEDKLTSLGVMADQAVAGDQAVLESIETESRLGLTSQQSRSDSLHRPFHWALEFPEVLAGDNNGFDAIVGNPPFLGGRQLHEVFGAKYQNYLKYVFSASNNRVDLICFFFRLSQKLLSEQGYLGLLSTNSIADSDNRLFALDTLLSDRFQIVSAVSPIVWPGSAGVDICFLLMARDGWSGQVTLNGSVVKNISSRISSTFDASSVNKLIPPIKYSEGTKLYGKAFIDTRKNYSEICRNNRGLDKYLRIYVNGDVLNGRPLARDEELLVVDFENLDKDEIGGCDEFIRTLSVDVAEERKNQTRQIHEHRPWLHWDKRLKFYAAARTQDRIIATVIVSSHLIFHFVNPQNCFAHGIKLFLDDRSSMLGVLQSSLHYWWAASVSSSFRRYVRYSTSTSFDTFPFSEAALSSEKVASAADKLVECRQRVVYANGIGPTDLYNRISDFNNHDEEITELRGLLTNLDEAVARAYGWDDIDLKYDFEETAQGVRFTITEEVRTELLQRLLSLNNELKDKEEIDKRSNTRARPRGRRLKDSKGQNNLDLF